eukprot:190792-Pleurochrysis_carterae.AAC.1
MSQEADVLHASLRFMHDGRDRAGQLACMLGLAARARQAAKGEGHRALRSRCAARCAASARLQRFTALCRTLGGVWSGLREIADGKKLAEQHAVAVQRMNAKCKTLRKQAKRAGDCARKEKSRPNARMHKAIARAKREWKEALKKSRDLRTAM